MGIQNWFQGRETGQCNPTRFTRRSFATLNMAERLGHHEKLEFQKIKSIEFNSGGDLLLLGSRRKDIVFWDWEAKTERLSYDSGHSRNIYRIKILPMSDEKRIATATRRGQVRLGEVMGDGQVHTKSLAEETYQYGDPSCSLAAQPGDPNLLYSCGGNAIVTLFDIRNNSSTKLLRCYRLARGKYCLDEIPLHDIVVNPRNPNYFCIGGSDAYARVYDVRKLPQYKSFKDQPVDIFCPENLMDREYTYITGLAYSNSGELLVSYHDDLTYLFQKDMGFGDSSLSSAMPNTIPKPQIFVGHRNDKHAKGLSFFGPNDDYVMSGSSCGHVFIWKKNGVLVRLLRSNVEQIKAHPHLPVLATLASRESIDLWGPSEPNDHHPLPEIVMRIMEINEVRRRNTRKLRNFINRRIVDLENDEHEMGDV